MTIDGRGDLVMSTAAGPLRQTKPVAYQQVGGRRRAVSGRYELNGARRVGIGLGRYDRSRPLVIDPAITYATALEGAANGIAVDSASNAYITGTTSSATFPTTTGAFQTAQPAKSPTAVEFNAAFPDAFVMKVDTRAAGAASLVYATYLGGHAASLAADVAVDGVGAAYLTGVTYATNFPTNNPIASAACGLELSTFTFRDQVFVTKLNPAGSALAYSTCLPGTRTEGGNTGGTGISVDGSGAAYVAGRIDTGTLAPTAGAAQTTFGGGLDAFLAKLNPAGSAMTYLTYLGGSGEDFGDPAVAVDAVGDAYLAGKADAGFPTTAGALQTMPGGGGDGFVAKIHPVGGGASDLVYSTYLGGAGSDVAQDVAVRAGEAYVAGQSCSSNFPLQIPIDATLGGTCDGFVSKLNISGSSLAYSTYLGEENRGIAVDATGRAHVTGRAGSDLPAVDALPFRSCGVAVEGRAFMSTVMASGSALDFSSCIDGEGHNGTNASAGSDVAVDGSQSAYVVGSGPSDELPLVNALREEPSDGFLVKLAATPPVPVVARSEPAGGPTTGGTRVVINGSNLSGATAVSFDGTPAQSFTVDSSTQITAVSPARGTGKTTITVTNGSGSTRNGQAVFRFGEGGWQVAHGLKAIHADAHTATLLPSGQILVAGGRGVAAETGHETAAAELYDPVTGRWTSTGSMGTPRAGHTATLLPNGKVLVAGGRGPAATLATAELYDPESGQWAPTAGNLVAARRNHSATLIGGPASLCGSRCGMVLLAGAEGSTSAQLFNPATGTFSATGAMQNARGFHQAIQLTGDASVCGARCGKVLAVGGRSFHPTPGGPVPGSELYDPLTGTWTLGPEMGLAQREFVGAALLPSGRVLAAGGFPANAGEIYDPLANSWSPVANLMLDARTGPGTALLPNGKVLVAGGRGRLQSAEVYDPGTNRFAAAGGMQARRGGLNSVSATLLSSSPSGFAADSAKCGSNCGKVLIVGGSRFNFADLYVPPPEISGLESSSAAPGTTVRLTGRGFTHGVRSVSFGGVEASSFTVEAYGRLTAVVPDRSPATVDVRVVNDGGVASRANAFTILPGPGQEAPPSEPEAPLSPGSGPVVPGRDGVRPVVSGVSVLDREFSIGSLLPLLARQARVGTRIRFRLSEPGTARLSFARARSGRRVGSSCRRPSRRLAGRRRCTRYVTVSPAVVIRGARAGVNSVRFQGRLSRNRRLSPGRYRVTVTATDAAANRSLPKSTTFTLLRPPRTRGR